MNRSKKKKCKNCNRMFMPDCRNYDRQWYCDKPECRKASKAESQRKWLAKPENIDHFKGPVHVERVRQWRKKNPGYWKRKKPDVPEPEFALQESLNLQQAELTNKTDENCISALQDSLNSQQLVIIGLISQISGFTLQEDIAGYIRRMQQSGQEISTTFNSYGGICDDKSPDFETQTASDSQKFQLDRSQAGP